VRTKNADPFGSALIIFGDVGGAERDRTVDLLNAIQALSQLSYGPTFREAGGVTPAARQNFPGGGF
jgi:hypothetical protein